VVALGLLHRLAHLGQRCHVDDGVAVGVLERGAHQHRVADVPFDERRPGRDGRAVTPRQVVVDGHRVAARQKARGDHAADVAGAAGDQDVHEAMLTGRSQCPVAAAVSSPPW